MLFLCLLSQSLCYFIREAVLVVTEITKSSTPVNWRSHRGGSISCFSAKGEPSEDRGLAGRENFPLAPVTEKNS